MHYVYFIIFTPNFYLARVKLQIWIMQNKIPTPKNLDDGMHREFLKLEPNFNPPMFAPPKTEMLVFWTCNDIWPLKRMYNLPYACHPAPEAFSGLLWPFFGLGNGCVVVYWRIQGFRMLNWQFSTVLTRIFWCILIKAFPMIHN